MLFRSRTEIDQTELKHNWLRVQDMAEDDPLRDDAPHWRAPDSELLFDRAAGLRIPPACELLHAGVVAAGHMSCASPEGLRWMTFDEACARCPELSRGQHARRQWEEVVEELQR